MSSGGYARTFNDFSTSGVDAGPLHAPSSVHGGGNGVNVYGPCAFPTATYQATNYWVDVLFRPQ